TTLYPNAEQPNHGVFVENRLRHLVADGAVDVEVVAPVPFFPSGARLWGSWSRYARVPARETRHGLRVHHPRFAVIPKVGMTLAPGLLARSAERAVARLRRDGLGFDAIDAHYVYPDGVAAVALGRRFGVPVVITARGSDVTQIATYPRPRATIQRAVRQAAWLITVSAALRDGLVALGADPERVTVLRNGVDTQMFRPADRGEARRALRLTRPTLISVGLLIERKRHHLTIEAMRLLPDCELLIVGEGPERARLAALVEQHRLGERVRLLGGQPHARLPEFYSAADVMVLASSREGWANVLLEAMACGTPAIAMRIGGNAEVIRAAEAGRIVEQATPEAIAETVRALLADPPPRAATCAYAEKFGWGETTAGQISIFRSVVQHAVRRPEREAVGG
ncbi:MAG: glycosyltransferase family 4 protein, partial [Acetobacteraceae bacterium]|nr:glycosyltransferase family 4 protein [Acetobacteraceae bacterium]